jgi:putative membrane protein
MKRLLSQIIAAIAGLWLASSFIPGVVIRTYPVSNFFGFSLAAQWQILVLLGIVLGLINFFLKPIINTITLPLRIITLGLFSIVINMGLLWLLDVMFDELYVPLWLPLLYTTLTILALNLVIGFFLNNKNED